MAEQPQQPQQRQMSEKGMYLFMEGVSHQTIKPVIEWIIEENLSPKKKKSLTLIVNSPGGDVNACMALIDTMKGSKIPVHTIGIGVIASCGLLIFMSGAKGFRTLTPNTSILSHQYSWGSIGKEHELFGAVREMELTSRRLIEHYKKCTGQTEKVITEKLLAPTDAWLNAKEAKKYGFCDHIKEMY